jgi:hypothetical protein
MARGKTTIGHRHNFRQVHVLSFSAFLYNRRATLVLEECGVNIYVMDHPVVGYFETMSLGCFMVLNATFNNISVIYWPSVLLVDETGVPRENHRHITSHFITSCFSEYTPPSTTHNFSGDRQWLHSKCNYHIITTMTAAPMSLEMGIWLWIRVEWTDKYEWINIEYSLCLQRIMFVVITIRSSPHSWLNIGFIARVKPPCH